jgi:hypothetical protein
LRSSGTLETRAHDGQCSIATTRDAQAECVTKSETHWNEAVDVPVRVIRRSRERKKRQRK